MYSININLVKKEVDLSKYSKSPMPVGTLLMTAKGNLLRVYDYWERSLEHPAYYNILVVNRNERFNPSEYDVLKAIEKGEMWEVQIVTN